MFENPSGKLRIIVCIGIYICMIVSIVVVLYLGGLLGILAFPVVALFWWIVGLFWLYKIDQAIDIHEIRSMMEDRLQSKPAPVTRKGSIVKPTSGTGVVHCPSCGKSQYAGNQKCFACGAEIKTQNS